MLAQPLQDELVVHETLDGLEQERVERQVADLLQLKLFVNGLQLLQPLGSLFQLRQHLIMLLEEAGELLMTTSRPESGLEPRSSSEKLNKTHLPSAHTCSLASRHRSSGSRL